ncbi:MAG: tRNA lysidine(34) synthetase TilS [Acidobacteria bacterium]|nr:tRNA lysidine(34) synthetase TilS [Acidobacteriota bacterium]
MLERIAETIARYGMFEPGVRVGVAVSGGADSVCLLEVLHRLAPRWALALQVLHLNHHLRGEESDADARFVEALAGEFGLPFVCGEARLEDAGENLEQAAREARQAFFREQGLPRIATGHTRSDQAETVLFRFLRGSGTAGLAGIRPVTSEGIVRPLLAVTRGEVREYLAGRGLTWREDSTNCSADFARNRIRRQLLPQLTAEWNPALEQALAQVAELARDEEAYWGPEIERLFAGSFTRQGGFLVHSLEASEALAVAVRRRLFRRVMREVRGDLRQIEFDHVERLLQLAEMEEGHGRVILPGVDVVRSFRWLRFGKPGAENGLERNWRFAVAPPVELPIPGNRFSLSLQLIRKADRLQNEGYNEGSGNELDWESLTGPLVIRNWRPGDEYCPAGRESPQKIKTIFQDSRIPLWERRNWPILTSGGDIAWASQFGVAERFRVSNGTKEVLQIEECRRLES